MERRETSEHSADKTGLATEGGVDVAGEREGTVEGKLRDRSAPRTGRRLALTAPSTVPGTEQL